MLLKEGCASHLRDREGSDTPKTALNAQRTPLIAS